MGTPANHASGSPTAVPPNPVSAAIEAHRSARATLAAACGAADEVPDDAPEGALALAALDAASTAETAAWEALLATRPADAAGLVRMLRYVAGAAPREVLGDARDLGRHIAEAAEAALLPGPSAYLVAMVAEWQALLGRINAKDIEDEEAEALGERLNALQRAIFDFPSTSAADLLAKVPVLQDELRDALGGLAEGADPKDTLSGAAWFGLFRDFEHLARGTTPACVPSASVSDPVFAVIAEHRVAYAEWDRLSEVWSTMDPGASGYAEAQAASDVPGRREIAAYEALFSAKPATLAGALALAEYLGDAVRRVRIDAEPTDGEMALRTLTAALRGLVTATAAPLGMDLDPALAAFAASRRAEAEMAAFDHNGEEEAVWRAREDDLAAAQVETREAAWAAIPTTRAGRRALVDYARFQVGVFTGPSGHVDDSKSLFEDMLGAFAAAIDGEQPERAPDHPDAGLFALGLPFLAAWRDEAAAGARATERPDDPEAQRAFREAAARCGHLGDQIALQAASTAEGLGVKALVLSRYASEDMSPAEPIAEPRGAPVGSDIAFLWQIQTGARRLLDGVAPTAPARAPGPDLPAMSIGELADLHDACLQASRHLAALVDRFGADEERWRARVVIDQEADRLGDLALACVEELQGRTATTEDERAERVSVLAGHAARFHAWADLAALAISEASAGRRR